MSENSNQEQGSVLNAEIRSDRRDFMKGAAVAGVIGAAGLMASSGAQAQTAQQSDDEDPQKPAGIRPEGSFDCRFPISYNRSVPEGMRILTQYFQAMSERNLDGMIDLIHFPFVTYEGPFAYKIDSPDQLRSNPPLSMNVSGKGPNLIKKGSYDMLSNMQMHMFNPIGAGFTMLFDRYTPDGNRIFQCHGIYGITNNDGKWGIEFFSTIFKAANQVGRDDDYTLSSVDRALHDNHRDKVMSRREADLPMVRKMVIDPFAHGSVWIGGSTVPGQQGNPMEPYKIKGVKSRLRFSDGDTDEFMAKQNYNQANFRKVSGAGVGLWANSVEIPETRALYASPTKGHYYSGYYRYTENGTVISEHRYLGCEICRKGVWYGHDIATTFGQVLYHDWTNDGVKEDSL